jgi:isopentenyl-diphosphate delta-isomerase
MELSLEVPATPHGRPAPESKVPAGPGRKPEVSRVSLVDSTDEQPLVLVNDRDEQTGLVGKAAAHRGEGQLHRAFSLLVFDQRGRLLLQQRASAKPLWPGYWSNSCCSHPGPDETPEAAARRRARQELGIEVEPRFVYRFRYQARYLDIGSEHELCSVLVARTDDPIRANPTEVADWRFVSPERLTRELATTPERFTPWFLMEWAHLVEHFPALFERPGAAIT